MVGSPSPQDRHELGSAYEMASLDVYHENYHAADDASPRRGTEGIRPDAQAACSSKPWDSKLEMTDRLVPSHAQHKRSHDLDEVPCQDDIQPWGRTSATRTKKMPKLPETCSSKLWIAHQQRYKYLPLESHNHIRLIKLFPGRLSDPLVCTLVHVDLESAPKFEAISYFWGTDRSARLYVSHGSEGELFVLEKVTTSLEAALTRFRRSNECRLLWADAVCINQEDLAKRGHQVAKLMASIYRTADTVLIWLGREDRDSRAVVELSRSLTKQIQAWKQENDVHGGFDSSLKLDLRTRYLENNHAQAMTSIFTQQERYASAKAYDSSNNSIKDTASVFFERPWFRRVWVRLKVYTHVRHRPICALPFW